MEALLLPFLLSLSLFAPTKGKIGPERKDQLQREIVKNVLKSLIVMSKVDLEKLPVAQRLHTEGCTIAGQMDRSRLERYRSLNAMIGEDRQMKEFIFDQEMNPDEYIDDWLEMAEENQWRLDELTMNSSDVLGRLCAIAFSPEFRNGDKEQKKVVIFNVLRMF